jgi:GMP synthase (glutamine-hydrolysing)
VVVLDFGSQTSQLIVRRVREAGVYCELLPWDAPDAQVAALAPRAFILSGGPASVYETDAPTLPPFVLDAGVPVLGICYGMQLLAHDLGGQVAPSTHREYGPAAVDQTTVGRESPLLAELPDPFPVWVSHGDRIEAPPPGFAVLGTSANAPFAAMGRAANAGAGVPIYGIQFHPEVVHTPQGARLLANFLFRVAGLRGDWSPASFVEEAVTGIRDTVGQERVLCGLSGGVDSAVVAALLHRAIGDQLTCIFVDTGLLREGEADQVMETR